MAFTKKDIFISYSSEDRAIVDGIVEYLESSEGGGSVSCWMDKHREKNDISVGEKYPEEILKAINTCKGFLLVISRNSIISNQVIKEVILANDREKMGLSLFAVIIDDEIPIQGIDPNIDYIYAGSERKYWFEEGVKESLKRGIFNKLAPYRLDEKAVISGKLPVERDLFGRTEDVKIIKEQLFKKQKLFIHGMPGIGKTVLVEKLSHELCNDFDSVIYLVADRCLMYSLESDEALRIECDYLDKKRSELTFTEYTFTKLALLEANANPGMLLVIDNLDNIYDPLLERVLGLDCFILITSRSSQIDYNITKYQLNPETDNEVNRKIFEKHYGRKVDDNEWMALSEVVKYIGAHPMMIIIIAKQLKYEGKSPADANSIYDFQKEYETYISRMSLLGDYSDEIHDIYRKIVGVFGIEKISELERRILTITAILPIQGVDLDWFISLFEGETIDIMGMVRRLDASSWLQVFREDDRLRVSIHPLIRDAVLNGDKFLTNEVIKWYIPKLQKLITNSWDKGYQEIIQYKDLAMSFYYYASTPTIENYRFFIDLSRYFWAINHIQLSIEIRIKVKSLFFGMSGGARLVEEGEACFQLGLVLFAAGEYEKALEELENAYRALSNRYAGVLSHWGQTLMLFKENDPESVIKSMEESYIIRTKNSPGSIEAAAASHLLAKAICHYNNNQTEAEERLKKAIEIEEAALKTFEKFKEEKEEQAVANITSSMYILGRLKMISAGGNKSEMTKGFELLNEAEKLRLELKNKNALHPWMEDIYLKKIQGYIELGREEEAFDYLINKLIPLQKNKYKNKNDPFLIKSVRLLLELAQKLGCPEEAAKYEEYMDTYGDEEDIVW